MTETPGDPRPDYGSTPPPPPPPGGQGYPPPPPSGYEQPPAYQPPPAAPPATSSRRPTSRHRPRRPATSSRRPTSRRRPHRATAAAGRCRLPAAGRSRPADQGGFAAGASNVGQQFQNFDPKSLQNFDPKTVNPLDWGIIAAGVLSLILFSFFGYYQSRSRFEGVRRGLTDVERLARLLRLVRRRWSRSSPPLSWPPS